VCGTVRYGARKGGTIYANTTDKQFNTKTTDNGSQSQNHESNQSEQPAVHFFLLLLLRRWNEPLMCGG